MDLGSWMAYKLYPTLFESIDRVLPEHKFKRYAGGWRSQTYLDGSPHKDRIDKTVVTKWKPMHILQQGEMEIDLTEDNESKRKYILELGGKQMELVDYVMRRDGVDFITAVKTLAKVVGLKLPKDQKGDNEFNWVFSLIENFSLETFFRIALGCVAIFFGIRLFITAPQWD